MLNSLASPRFSAHENLKEDTENNKSNAHYCRKNISKKYINCGADRESSGKVRSQTVCHYLNGVLTH